jgi:multidrug efflux pump subunit AcrA (membrane-fusion protein)
VRRKLTIAGIVVAVAMAAFLARAAFSGAGGDAAGVPVFEVRPAPFVRTVSAEGTLRPVKASPLTAPGEGRSLIIAWLAEDGAPVKKGDVVIRFDNDEAARALADGRDDHAAALARIARERQQVGHTLNERARTAALTKDEIAEANELGKKDPRYFPRNEVIESEIDQALLSARLKQTEVVAGVEQRLGESRVALLAVDRQKADIQTRKAADMLRSMEVRAPHDGTVVLQRWGWGQRILQAGDRAFTGMRIADVTMGDRMEAEINVLEADAGGLLAGQRASVLLDARPDLPWKAKVKKVDPFPKAKHPEVPTQYFGAVLELEGDTSGVKPGQRLVATIVLDDVAAALVVPRQAVFRDERGSFVHRLRRFGLGFEPARVTLGPGTVGRVAVTEGLGSGDRIALRDPRKTADEAVAPPPEGRRSPGSAPSTGGGRRGGR